MNKDLLISAFTFGIFLILVGLIGRFFDWKQANLIFIMGVIFEIAALGIYMFQKIKK